MGLESILLGAHAEGVRNVLAVTGDPPEIGDYPGSRGVYEVDSIGLARIVSQLNQGEDFNGKASTRRRRSSSASRSTRPPTTSSIELDRFRQKIEAGAQLRDDAGAVRPLLPRPLRGAARRLAGAGAARDLLRPELPARASGCTTRCRGSSCRSRAARARARGPERAAPRASRSRASSTPRRASKVARRLRDPAVQAARGRARALRLAHAGAGRDRPGARLASVAPDDRGRERRSRREPSPAPRRPSTRRRRRRRRPGPPELPCWIVAAQARHRARTGPCPYASWVRTVSVVADPARRTPSSGPFSG